MNTNKKYRLDLDDPTKIREQIGDNSIIIAGINFEAYAYAEHMTEYHTPEECDEIHKKWQDKQEATAKLIVEALNSYTS